MLHNRVSILKWHLFILSIPLFRVIDPCTFDGIIFNGTTLPIYINTTCYIAYHQGHSTFFLLVELFEVDRRIGRGHLYFGVDIILVKHFVNQQWVQTCWLVPSWAELTTIFPSMTVLFVFGQKWERPERRSSPSSRTFYYRPNTCQLATVTVGRPSRVKVQETNNSLCPWSCWSFSH